MNGIIYFFLGVAVGVAVMIRFPYLSNVLHSTVSQTKDAIQAEKNKTKPIISANPYKPVDITKEIPFKPM